MPVLDAQKLTKSLGTRTLLGGIDLVIEDGEHVGLVGPNGCGKSTLSRILAGIDPADGGEVHKRREARVIYLAQEPTFSAEETALEAVLSGLGPWQDARARHAAASEKLGRGEDHDRAMIELEEAAHDVERLGGWERDHEARSILGHLGIERLDAVVTTMSGGERRRVALARVLVARPDLAILDEPTNHLDVESIEWLERYLANDFVGAVLLVTHDRWFLNQVVTRTLELDRGVLTSFDGGWEEYLEGRLEREMLQNRAESNRQNLLRKELAWLRRTPAARTGKQKARIHRAEAAIATEAPPQARNVELSMASTRMGRTVVDLAGVTLTAPDGRVLVSGLDLSLTKGERIGIVGPNGCGKSTLLRAILGEIAPAKGTITRGVNTKVAYLDQLRSGLDEKKTVADNVAPNTRHVEWAGRRMELVSYLDRMLFDGHQQRQPVSALSGGERARVLIAKMMLESANLLVLDEPTNDLDAPTLGALEEMLGEFEGTALVVTHDRWFLERVATAILAFEPIGAERGGEQRSNVRKWEGNYSTWRALSAAQGVETPKVSAGRSRPSQAPAPVTPAQPAPAAVEPPPTKKKALSFKEQRELDGILEKIEASEAEVLRLEKELGDPDVYAKRGAQISSLIDEVEAAKVARDTLIARWEELESKRAG